MEDVIRDAIKRIRKDYRVQADIIKSPGKFEGEQIATVYFWDQMMDGAQDDTMELDGDTYDVFSVSEEEREGFHLFVDTEFYCLQHSVYGFVYGQELTAEELRSFVRQAERQAETNSADEDTGSGD